GRRVSAGAEAGRIEGAAPGAALAGHRHAGRAARIAGAAGDAAHLRRARRRYAVVHRAVAVVVDTVAELGGRGRGACPLAISLDGVAIDVARLASGAHAAAR